MKLLYCIPSLANAGGMERVLSEKVNYLVNLRNYEITIVTTDQKDKDVWFALDNRIRLVHFNIDFDAHYAEIFLFKYIMHRRKLKIYKCRLAHLIKDLGVNICISLCGKEIDFLSDLDVNCKKIAEIHFSMNNRKQFITSHYKGIFWRFLGDFRTLQLRKATKGLDKLVVLTKADQQQWEQTHNNIVQIPNPNPFLNKDISKLLTKRVISIGKLDAQKGYDMLVEVWRLVAIKHPDWILNIFGEGEWEHFLRDRINELNLSGKINLCGNTIDVVSNYLDSSIYVLSSRYEGMPMVLIEAMSCGLPIVTFDCEYGPGEMVIDGENGFLVPLEDLTKLAEKICVLIENESLRIEMGAKSFEYAKLYSKQPIMNRWIDLFNQIYKAYS